MRFLASVSYDGSKYHGFQRLKANKTIQGELEKALTKINKTLVMVKGAGRTDRGVHAFNQIVHFDLNINITADALKLAMNGLVDKGIYINYCELVNEDFHARFNAIEKTYEYVLNLGEYDPLDDDYLYNYNRVLNIKAMKKASKFLIGKHSYKAFVSGIRDNYDSIIYQIKFKRKKEILLISFTGKSFYTHMVRNLVGALILVGQEKIEPSGVEEMLLKEMRLYNYVTAPASGLYLTRVKY